MKTPSHPLPLLGTLLVVAACGGTAEDRQARIEAQRQNIPEVYRTEQGGLFGLLGRTTDTGVTLGVNRYLWTASLDTLSILPIEAADPFSGVITTGWGRVNGAATPYRMTVYISDPALDARALRVAVFRQQGGRAVAVSDEIARTVEDAILTRARQIRVAELDRR
ncbi:MAG: DUF3576 domain-containing protein [Pseudomonadota bacterium]